MLWKDRFVYLCMWSRFRCITVAKLSYVLVSLSLVNRWKPTAGIDISDPCWNQLPWMGSFFEIFIVHVTRVIVDDIVLSVIARLWWRDVLDNCSTWTGRQSTWSLRLLLAIHMLERVERLVVLLWCAEFVNLGNWQSTRHLVRPSWSQLVPTLVWPHSHMKGCG